MHYSISEFPPYHHLETLKKLKTYTYSWKEKNRGHGVTLYVSVYTSSVLFRRSTIPIAWPAILALWPSDHVCTYGWHPFLWWTLSDMNDDTH